MIRHIARLLVVACAALGAMILPVRAEYPDRAVTIVVPYSAGGNTDIIARIVADHLTEELGQPVVVENRGGGGGTVGSAMVAGAEADGYTLLFGTAGSHSINPNIRKIKYDPIKDFEPVSVAAISSVLIVVHPSVEAKSLEELIKLTSSGEKQFNFASGGTGTAAHVAGELYNEKTGSSLVHVPYKGAGPALNDVVAGRIQVYMNNIPAILPHVKSQALRPMALASKKRSKLLPDVPTTSEAGLKDFEMGSWYGLLAPSGTPQEAVDRLYKAMASMQESKKVEERLAAIGLEVTVSDSPAEFKDFMKQQLDWWGGILDSPKFKKK